MMIDTATMPATTPCEAPVEDTLVQEIRLALRRTGYLELFDIDVFADGCDVWLRGRVPSYFLKQKAEYLIRSIPTIAAMKSDIEVSRG